MGIQTSARLIYGIALPSHIEDDQLDEVLASDPQFTDLDHAWAGTWKGGTRYLAAYYRSADLGEPATIPTFDLNPATVSGCHTQLRAAWTALGLASIDMPVPAWTLTANAT